MAEDLGAIFQPGLPVGAAASRSLPTGAAVTKTTCGYCGVGCALEAVGVDGRVTAVLPDRDGPVNRGHACVKGRFAHGFLRAPDRLTQPLMRRNGDLEPVSWTEALDHIVAGFRTALAEGGPDSIAAICSSRATNEENYLVQKFMRTVIGTNNIDNCSRLCHAPTAAGLTASFGLAGGTDSFDQIGQADALLVVGANPVEAHPVVGARLLDLALGGAKLVVADPREGGLAKYADLHVHPRPGTNVALCHGIAHVMLAVQRVRAAAQPPGQARTVDIVHAIATAFGADPGCPTPAAALDECARTSPLFTGLSHARLVREGAIAWPCPHPDQPGHSKLYTEQFATADGRARLAAMPYLPPGEQPDDTYPLVLITGRRLTHYNTGSMTRRTGNLALEPVDLLDVHPDDAARHHLRDRRPVTVESRHGRARLTARISTETPPGHVFCAIHFPDSGVNALTSDHADTVTACPEYKVTAVRLS